MNPSRIERIECMVYRVPIERPVRTSFGAMTDRAGTFVRVTAEDGAFGWGEVFSNFPQVGAEHRARLVHSLFDPLLKGRECDDPVKTWRWLEAQLRRLAIQCGEPGPFAQIIGAIDQALWDLKARRAQVPLWRLLAADPRTQGDAVLKRDGAQGEQTAPDSVARVRVYASGFGPTAVGEMSAASHALGFRAIKFKVGFGVDVDRRNFLELRDAVGPDVQVMVDANQAWDPDEAPGRVAELMEFSPLWIEEPMPADVPVAVWAALATGTGAAFAAGENLRGLQSFDEALRAGFLRFVQPDVAKWGGISGCREVALLARELGVEFCPHWLAGGVGLAASLHLRAAMGQGGYAEVDANPNPLRQAVCPIEIRDGWVTLSEAPGIGVDPSAAGLEQYRIKGV